MKTLQYKMKPFRSFAIIVILMSPAFILLQKGWVKLDQTQWINPATNAFPEKGWIFEDGILSLEGKKGGSIISREKYGNFELAFEYKIAPGANSGIKYFASKEYPNSGGGWLGLEYQLIDDTGYPGELKAYQKTASLYDLIPPSSEKKLNPAGEWNQVLISSRGKKLEHWLNGIKVVEVERGSEPYRKAVSESKFNKYSGFGEISSGHLLLQDHGGDIEFRDIRIRRL